MSRLSRHNHYLNRIPFDTLCRPALFQNFGPMVRQVIGIVALAFAATASAQSPLQDKLRRELGAMPSEIPAGSRQEQEYVRERLEVHKETRELSWAKTAWLRARILRESENKLSSFLPEDRQVLESIAHLDRHAIERAAVEPLLLTLCSGTRQDSSKLGHWISDIERDQETAFETAVQELLDGLTLDGVQRLKELGDGGGTKRVTNWAGVAAELPEVMGQMVQTVCFRYRAMVETEHLQKDDR